ncbi:MAG: response regulator [Chloroherpetonaceae bacterium]
MASEFRILIVEDNFADEQLFKATLSQLSLSIDVARDGKEALQKVKTSEYDLMILDMILPNASGIELLKEIKRENIPLPITIVYSALSAENQVMECLKLGASSYLIKPVSPIDLLNSISDCLALSTKRKSISENTSSSRNNKPLTLTRAMAEVTSGRRTGQILVETHDGVGVLEYASGKLTAARFKALSGLVAIETLRTLPHRSVIVQLVG